MILLLPPAAFGKEGRAMYETSDRTMTRPRTLSR